MCNIIERYTNLYNYSALLSSPISTFQLPFRAFFLSFLSGKSVGEGKLLLERKVTVEGTTNGRTNAIYGKIESKYYNSMFYSTLYVWWQFGGGRRYFPWVSFETPAGERSNRFRRCRYQSIITRRPKRKASEGKDGRGR